MIKVITTLFLCAISLCCCSAGEPSSPLEMVKKMDLAVIEKYSFVNIAADTIIDPNNTLSPFIDGLKHLSSAKRAEELLQLPILHYGDSHVQAGYLTEIIRRRLQLIFGNAGRGLVVPFKLAASNEPRDFSISSDSRFESSKVTNRGALDFDPGVSGIAIKSSLPVFKIRVLDIPEDSIDYKFNRVIAFHDSLAPMITANETLLADNYGSDIFYSYTTNVELADATKEIELYTYKENQYANGPFYGFSLENNNSGILYHAIGVNSACYLHWGLRDKAAAQSVALNPSLIIISLGSNEAAGRNFIESVFLKEVDSFVLKLRKANPNTPILITSPAETMRRGRNGSIPNTNFTLVSMALQRYCAQENLAYLDLFHIIGGGNSSQKFANDNLLQRDRIHFTIEGYTLQGLLIFNAIINDYLKYAR